MPINDVAVHPRDPDFVATASKDQALRLWNIHTKARRGAHVCV
jgi:hypothetical protein